MIRVVPAFVVFCGTACPSLAQTGDTLLTIELESGTRHYDMAALKALPVQEFTTSTPWTHGPQHFAGVPVSALLEDAGITDGAFHAVALNEYAVTMDVAAVQPDADGNGPIIAYLADGAEMTRRDKGPLWLIWPYDAAPHYRTEVLYAGSVWQLESIRHIPPAE